jgi:hypothetical protein
MIEVKPLIWSSNYNGEKWEAEAGPYRYFCWFVLYRIVEPAPGRDDFVRDHHWSCWLREGGVGDLKPIEDPSAAGIKAKVGTYHARRVKSLFEPDVWARGEAIPKPLNWEHSPAQQAWIGRIERFNYQVYNAGPEWIAHQGWAAGKLQKISDPDPRVLMEQENARHSTAVMALITLKKPGSSPP